MRLGQKSAALREADEGVHFGEPRQTGLDGEARPVEQGAEAPRVQDYGFLNYCCRNQERDLNRPIFV